MYLSIMYIYIYIKYIKEKFLKIFNQKEFKSLPVDKSKHAICTM